MIDNGTIRSLKVCDAATACRLRKLLASHDDLYPGIEAWFQRRVRPELASGQRKVWVLEKGEDVVGEAILKLTGQSAKLCSMFVPPEFRGTTLASHLLYDVLKSARNSRKRSIHFTIGEDCAHEHGGYFERLGFRRTQAFSSRYRRGVDEFLYCADAARVDAKLYQYLRRQHPDVNRNVADPGSSWGSALRAAGARISERQGELFPQFEIL